MSTRRTAILAAAFAVLVLYFAIFERFSLQAPPPPWDTGDRIVECAPGDPTAMTVSGPRGKASGEQQYGRWSGSAGDALGDLAEALCRLPVLDRITDAPDLASFGLAAPEIDVTLVTGAGTRVLLVGDSTPAQNLLYVKFADRPEVLKVGVQVRSEIDKVLSSLRPTPAPEDAPQ